MVMSIVCLEDHYRLRGRNSLFLLPAGSEGRFRFRELGLGSEVLGSAPKAREKFWRFWEVLGSGSEQNWPGSGGSERSGSEGFSSWSGLPKFQVSVPRLLKRRDPRLMRARGARKILGLTEDLRFRFHQILRQVPRFRGSGSG